MVLLTLLHRISCLRKDKCGTYIIKKGIKKGERREFLCEMGMEIASLKFPNKSGIVIRTDVFKFQLSLMVDGRKLLPQLGMEGSPGEKRLLKLLQHIRKEFLL